MNDLFHMYLDYIKSRKLSENTIDAYTRDIKRYSEFLAQNNLSMVNDDRMAIISYVQELNRLGRSKASVARFIISLRNFYKYLYKCGKISSIPVLEYEIPKAHRDFPSILTVDEVDRLLNCPDISTEKGKRDKAMLELMYAAGLKASEILELKREDLNLKLGYLKCRGMKGRERILPIGSYALKHIEIYLLIRSSFGKDSENWLFVNSKENKITRQGFWKILKAYGRSAAIDKDINLYTLRHSFAIHMIENGADIKSVQELLGYKSINALQIYLDMVDKNRLGEVYKKAHPRA